MPLANGLVGTGFASRYRLQPRAGFYRPNGVGVKATTPSSHSLTGLIQTIQLINGMCAHVL